MNDVRRILLVGDAHGDLDLLRRACDYAVANGCDALLQLGDLGRPAPSRSAPTPRTTA